MPLKLLQFPPFLPAYSRIHLGALWDQAGVRLGPQEAEERGVMHLVCCSRSGTQCARFSSDGVSSVSDGSRSVTRCCQLCLCRGARSVS